MDITKEIVDDTLLTSPRYPLRTDTKRDRDRRRIEEALKGIELALLVCEEKRDEHLVWVNAQKNLEISKSCIEDLKSRNAV